MSSKFQDMLKAQRMNPETARAGLKWDENDDNLLLKKVEEGSSIEDISKILQRTEGSVRTRLIIYGLTKMEKEGLSIEEVSGIIKIPVKDIENHKTKNQQRVERKQRTVNKHPITLDDVYNIVRKMEKKLDFFLSQ